MGSKKQTKPQTPLIEALRQYEASEVVTAFIDWLKEMEALQKSSWEKVIYEDSKNQDFLHEFEFETNNKKRAVIATRLHKSRCKRREAKDISKKLKPIVEFMKELQYRNLSKLFKKLQTDLKREEDHVNGERDYRPRVMKEGETE